VKASLQEVVIALLEAILLVVLVMFVFLQNFRATLIPAIAVPVVLLGTFGVLAATGYTINTLTMFALVLAIGLLVDDAIVVVENVERVMHEEQLSPRDATRKSMAEITPALVGIALTLSAVFVPMAFFGGSTGVIYRQFSITIVSAMALSVLVALTLTPALCATMLKPVGHAGPSGPSDSSVRRRWLARAFDRFNQGFERTSQRYERGVATWLKRSGRVMLVYLLICAGLAFGFTRLPTAFLPTEDQGSLTLNVVLPPGATNTRLQEVLGQAQQYFARQPDVISFNAVTGQGGNQSSARAFVRLKPWSERALPEQSAEAIAARATADLRHIRDAQIFVNLPPAVRGLGANAGLNFQIKDMNGLGREAMTQARDKLLDLMRERPEMSNVRSTNLEDAAQLAVVIDDRKAGALGLDMASINSTLSGAMGGVYINDFIDRGR